LFYLFLQIKKNIGLNYVAGFCVGAAFLAAVARQVTIRTQQQDNSGSVADLVRRGHLKSGQRGMYVLPSCLTSVLISFLQYPQ
jgi:hypothetical protein